MFCNFANKVAPLLEKSVYKFLILGCSLGLTLLVRIPQEYIFVNAWSLNYQRILFGEKIPTESIWSPPEHHHRAPLWLARLALEQDDPSMAQALVVPLLATGEPLALRILGQVFLAQGDLNAAVQSWVKIGDFFSLIQTAKLAESEGRLQDAELAYRGGWLAVPDAGTLPLANFLLNTKNDPVAAEEVLRISLERVQLPDLNWLRALGNSLRAQARWDEALKIYQKALAQNPEDIYTLSLIGRVFYEGKNDLDTARRIFEKMIALAPEKSDGYFYLAQVLASDGNYANADQMFQDALARNPDDAYIWLKRAKIAHQSGNLMLAMDVYLHAIQQFPNYAPLYFEISWVYQGNNQAEAATHAIQQALALQNPPNTAYYLRAGRIFEWSGAKAEAKLAYEQALILDSHNSAASDALNRLERSMMSP